MAKKSTSGEVNKSAAIRELYEQNPAIKVKEVIAMLAEKGIKVAPNLVYLNKGKIKGVKSQKRKVYKNATRVATAGGSTDTVKTIVKVKALASELGGLHVLKSLVDALSE